jgi:hypothetical protein
MLGWHISVYRLSAESASAAAYDAPDRQRLAVWQTGSNGLRWLVELVELGKAKDLGGGGYPQRYSVLARDLIPELADEPPEARSTWVCGPSDIIGDKWDGKTVIDRDALASCGLDEWLLVEAWDES